ncbi:MAG: hypothetical protein JO102_04755 [Elusimicrobia bacterium]|nr:hypothetical protein [Elusimicrobiota bacterium]
MKFLAAVLSFLIIFEGVALASPVRRPGRLDVDVLQLASAEETADHLPRYSAHRGTGSLFESGHRWGRREWLITAVVVIGVSLIIVAASNSGHHGGSGGGAGSY